MKRAKNIFISILLVAVLVLSGYIFLTRWQINHKEETPPVITNDWLSQEILEISELATLEYRYTNMGKFEDNLTFHKWNLPLTTKSFIISYDGGMKLGVDVQGVKTIVDNDEKIITVSVPKAIIISHTIYEDSVEIFDQSKNVFNPIQIEDYTEFAVDQKAKMEEKATNNGMFEDAYNNGVNQLASLISNLPEIADFTINFVNDEGEVVKTILPEITEEAEKE